MCTLRPAENKGEMEVLRALLREYATHLNACLGGEHINLKEYEQELAGLPAPYVVLLLAFVPDAQGREQPVGCVLLKPTSDDCEMKRLWVRPSYQGQGIGRKLVEVAIQAARQRGYRSIYLDTVPGVMQTAHQLYRKMGFEPVERYNNNPVPDVEFFRRLL